jgi:predicted DCC family thiol-disulfide oxidoreductase YuxK
MALLSRASALARRGLQAASDAFFAPVSAVPFGLFRIGWAFACLWSLVGQLGSVTRYYAGTGVFAAGWAEQLARQDFRFTLLNYVTDPVAVLALYTLLLVAVICMMLGVWTRLSSLLSLVLLATFQEHTFAIYAGGDTVLRVTGFLVAISPGTSALSVDRLLRQREHWLSTGTLLPPLTMPRWPRLLLTWQFIVIYITASWYKLLDPMWRNGSAVIISLQHQEFTRFPKWVNDLFAYFSVPSSYGTIGWQLSWFLMLIPLWVRRRLPATLQWYRLCILSGGLLFHGGIFVLMDAGIFSVIMMCSYLGIADADDYRRLRDAWNRWCGHSGRIAVLFDGQCSFCRQSVLPLLLSDWLKRLEAIDFHDAALRQSIAPDLSLDALDAALHIRLPDGRTFAGFDAFRELTKHLPAFWVLWPVLWLPGVAPVGRRVYAWIAARRTCLVGGACRLPVKKAIA